MSPLILLVQKKGPKMLKIHGDDLLHCRNWLQRNSRYNIKKTDLGNGLAREARPPFHRSLYTILTLEKTENRAKGAAGGTNHFDILFLYLLSLSHSRVLIFSLLIIFTASRAKKKRNYQHSLSDLPKRSRTVPALIFTRRRWYPKAFKVAISSWESWKVVKWNLFRKFEAFSSATLRGSSKLQGDFYYGWNSIIIVYYWFWYVKKGEYLSIVEKKNSISHFLPPAYVRWVSRFCSLLTFFFFSFFIPSGEPRVNTYIL